MWVYWGKPAAYTVSPFPACISKTDSPESSSQRTIGVRMLSNCATPTATTRFSSRAVTPQITNTVTGAIQSWPRNRSLGAAKIANIRQESVALGKSGSSRHQNRVQLSLMTSRGSLSFAEADELGMPQAIRLVQAVIEGSSNGSCTRCTCGQATLTVAHAGLNWDTRNLRSNASCLG
jgi:hypothetical protein